MAHLSRSQPEYFCQQNSRSVDKRSAFLFTKPNQGSDPTLHVSRDGQWSPGCQPRFSSLRCFRWASSLNSVNSAIQTCARGREEDGNRGRLNREGIQRYRGDVEGVWNERRGSGQVRAGGRESREGQKEILTANSLILCHGRRVCPCGTPPCRHSESFAGRRNPVDSCSQ